MRKDAEFHENFLSGGQLEIHAVAGLYVGSGEGRVLAMKVLSVRVFQEERTMPDPHVLALL